METGKEPLGKALVCTRLPSHKAKLFVWRTLVLDRLLLQNLDTALRKGNEILFATGLQVSHGKARPHMLSNDNYSRKPNSNPYTGRDGTKVPTH